MDAIEAIRNRRSVRNYRSEAIPRRDLELIVDAARLAPSGYNRQPWEFVVITQRAMIEQLTGPVAQWMDQAGALIAVVMDPASEYWLEDASAAIENMLIAATALGYGSCWVEGDALRREEALKEWLHIPPDRRLIALVPFGVPAERPKVEKKSLDEVIHWESYGSRP